MNKETKIKNTRNFDLPGLYTIEKLKKAMCTSLPPRNDLTVKYVINHTRSTREILYFEIELPVDAAVVTAEDLRFLDNITHINTHPIT
jgi:hypothetical protein